MKLGKKFKIGYIDDDGRFCPLAFAQSCSIDMKAASAEVSSPLTGGWVERRVKRNSWSMQHEGLLGSDTTAYKYQGKTYGFWGLMRKLWQDKYIFTARWTETDTSLTMQGQCFIEDMSQVASEKALTKISVKLSGTGQLLDLSTEDISGAFAYAIQGHTLTLYTVQRPLTGFTVHAGDTAVGLWDEATAGRTQSFTNEAITSSSVITAWKGESAAATQQTGVTFTDCTTLHVVLLQTEERDEQQQLHRYVQPLWWGGLSMGDMTLKQSTATVATFATAGLTGSAARVEIDPTIDITASGTWSLITDAPQTLHCCDRTTSLLRTLRMVQTQLNAGDSPYMGAVAMDPAAFSCQSTVWGNDGEGAEVFNVSGQELPTLVDMDTTLPDALHLHWQMTGLGVDESGPYTVQRELVSDMERHDVFYAYDATSGNLRMWCPSQVLDANVMAGGVSVYVGKLYDTDSEGNRVPVTISGVSAFSELSAGWGNYRFVDVSALTVLNLSNTLTISAWPLDDIVLTGEGGAEVGRIPALSRPDRTYPTYEVVTTSGSIVTGAHMETGAVQSLTYQTFFRTIVVQSSVTQTGNATWSASVRLLGNSDGSGGYAILPYNLSVKFGAHDSIVVPAGQHTVTQPGLTYDPSWQMPVVFLSGGSAGDFMLLASPAVDTTPAHWRADLCGTLGGLRCLDISYEGTIPAGVTVALSDENFMAETTVDSRRTMADSLYRTNRSAGDYLFTVNAGSSARGFNVTPTEQSDNAVQLTYVVHSIASGYTTDLTNLKTDGVTRSRRTNIGDVLPFVRVRKNGTGHTYQTNPIYSPVSMSLLKPGREDEVSAFAFSGIIDDADGLVEFVPEADFGCTNIISVGDGLPGVQLFSQNSTVDLPKA